MSSRSVEGPSADRPLRVPTPAERQLIEALLVDEFPGREALVEQVARVKVRQIDSEGSLELAGPGEPRAEVVRRVPVEAEVDDEDGVTVHVLLHVLDGKLAELEIYREDSRSLCRTVDASRLRVLNF